MTGLSVTILVAVFLILLAGLFAVIVERTTERDEARDQLKRERREHEAATADLDAENVRLHEALTEKQIADGTVHVPQLSIVSQRLVPTAHEGEYDLLPESAEVSDYTWPALAREIEHDDLTAIMRATEEES